MPTSAELAAAADDTSVGSHYMVVQLAGPMIACINHIVSDPRLQAGNPGLNHLYQFVLRTYMMLTGTGPPGSPHPSPFSGIESVKITKPRAEFAELWEDIKGRAVLAEMLVDSSQTGGPLVAQMGPYLKDIRSVAPEVKDGLKKIVKTCARWQDVDSQAAEV